MPALDIAELTGNAVKPAGIGLQNTTYTTYTTTLAHDGLGRPTQAVDGLDHTAQTCYRLSGWPWQLSVDGQNYPGDIQHNTKGQVLQMSQGSFDNGAASGSYITCLELKHYPYSGQEKDASALYYYGFRYYDPSCFRWTRSDPAGLHGSWLNWYAMLSGNPIAHRDMKGLIGETDKIVIGVLVPAASNRPGPMAALH